MEHILKEYELQKGEGSGVNNLNRASASPSPNERGNNNFLIDFKFNLVSFSGFNVTGGGKGGDGGGYAEDVPPAGAENGVWGDT